VNSFKADYSLWIDYAQASSMDVGNDVLTASQEEKSPDS
jgi:hypothetical protein